MAASTCGRAPSPTSIEYLTVLAGAGLDVGEALKALHTHPDQICHMDVKVRYLFLQLFRTSAL